jgi:tetratricopeptide (TPR) repeat protein
MKIRRIWQRLDRFAGWGCVLALFCLLIVMASLEVRDLDLWLHLKTGQYILESRAIPHYDIFSFTIAGKEWVNHEWLFQVIAALFYSLGGAEGLIKMQVGVVTITFLILFFMGFNPRKRNYFSVALPLLFVLLVYRSRFTIRPDIFSLLFFAFYLYLIHKHLDKKWIIFAIPLSQILWSNFHGFFFLGLFLLFIIIIAEFIKRRIRLPWEWNKANRLADQDYRRLKWVLLLSVLASLANPYLLNGLLYPFKVMLQLSGKSRIFFQYIQELKPALSPNTLFSNDGMVPYKCIILLSFISFVLNLRRLDIGKLFIWLSFLLSSVLAIRNIAYFSFVAYFVYLFNSKYIFPLESVSISYANSSIKYMTRIAFKAMFIFWIVFNLNGTATEHYYDFNRYEIKGRLGGISVKDYPEGAANFILNNKIRGNIFNDFNSGAFLIGKCFPQIHVYIDGRTEMYGPDFFDAYRKILAEDAQPFDAMAKKYKIKGAMFSGVYHPISNKLLEYLYKSKEWRLVYFDPFAVFFLKDIPENKKIIEKCAINLANWNPPETDLDKVGATAVYPFPNINRAYVLEGLGLDQAVIREARAALKVMPNCGSAFRFIGRVYKKQNLPEKAFENFRLAAIYLPRDPDLRIDLAMVYEKLNEPDNCIKQLNTAADIDPGYSRPYYYLSLLYLKQKNAAQSQRALAQAVRLPPPEIKDMTYVADGLYDLQSFAQASQVYLQAVKVDKKSANMHARLGGCYVYLDKLKEAESELSLAENLDHKLVCVHNYFGVLYAKQGMEKKAREQWGLAFKLDPQDKETKDNFQKFLKGGFKKVSQ